MNKREFIKRSIVGAVAIGASGAGSAAFAETAAKPRKPKTLKKKLGKTGFEVYPVIYGGIVSMQDGQKASDNYVAWALDRGINYFDVAPSYGSNGIEGDDDGDGVKNGDEDDDGDRQHHVVDQRPGR